MKMKHEEEDIQRSLCAYEDASKRFVYKQKRKFDLQYSQLYAVRLMAMRKKLIQSAERRWKEKCIVKQLSEIKGTEKCVIIGTLFRKMEMQPSILKEISQEEGVLPIPPSQKYVSDEDELILEEQQQRISLVGTIPLENAITGTILAVYGHQIDGGKFYVEDHCYTVLPTQVNQCLVNNEDRYIVFISGLGIGAKKDSSFKLQLFLDLITGKLGNEEDREKFSKICRVVIAGNSLSKDTQDRDSEKVAKYLSRNTQAKTVNAIKLFDDILVQLASSVPTDVMPGEFDPSNQFLPQQPLHRCMFPKATSYNTLRSVTNPYEAIVGGVRILGTSGQNISNIYQFTGFEDSLEILETTLKCGHASPTSPDTLSCYPYHDEDPFVIHDCPHIYFAGNQPNYQVKKMTGDDGQTIRIICIPSFEETGIAVMVNLRDLSCEPLLIDASLQ